MSIIDRKFNEDEFKCSQTIRENLEELKYIQKLYTDKIVHASMMTYAADEYQSLLKRVINTYKKVLENNYIISEKDHEDIVMLYSYIKVIQGV